ncbi:hypothetical protein BV22DRAFT_1118313 [Leucogyrophana mollusca]|uniref:Uncharacterized protein n=1 Tax=Leucogyrophana mollusca TaxID=85980 RepID=A0ACB8BQ10_9AGAM|nr:hypothetical protein BV22DRAFT_1118313 [Leucogyrophana mollusca]
MSASSSSYLPLVDIPSSWTLSFTPQPEPGFRARTSKLLCPPHLSEDGMTPCTSPQNPSTAVPLPRKAQPRSLPRLPPMKAITPRKPSRPFLKDMKNTLALQASETSHYVIEQPEVVSSYGELASRAPSSPHQRVRCAQATTILPIGPATNSIPCKLFTSPLRDNNGTRPGETLFDSCSLSQKYAVSDSYTDVLARGLTSKRSSSLMVSRSLNSLQSSTSNANFDFYESVMVVTQTPRGGHSVSIRLRQGGRAGEREIHNSSDQCLMTRSGSRSITPPLSPPPSSPSPATEGLSKRSGHLFALIPAKVGGEDVLIHALAEETPGASNVPSPEFILAKDLCRGEVSVLDAADAEDIAKERGDYFRDIHRVIEELDALAIIVRALPVPPKGAPPATVRLSSSVAAMPTEPSLPRDGAVCETSTWADKGKWKARTGSQSSTDPQSPEPQLPPGISRGTGSSSSHPHQRHSARYIYDPRGTPEFLIGNSNSLLAFPTQGYASPPRRFLSSPCGDVSESPMRHHIAGHQRPRPPLSAPPGSKTSFKAFFQRSRCNTTATGCPPRTIPLAHLPVESSVSRERRTRLPWLKI